MNFKKQVPYDVTVAKPDRFLHQRVLRQLQPVKKSLSIAGFMAGALKKMAIFVYVPQAYVEDDVMTD